MSRIGQRAVAWRSNGWLPMSPWTNSLGLARTLLAVGTAGTLALTPSYALLHPVAGLSDAPHCFAAAQVSAFCLLPATSFELARWFSVAVLVVVASGWRPALTALPHWWISFSVQNSLAIRDGGDQVAAVLTLLLLPVALTDNRRWHWARTQQDTGPSARNVVAGLGLVVIRLQVLAIYFHAAVAKFGVPEWANGTALYYIWSDPTLAPPPWLRGMTDAILRSPWGVVSLTWGSLVVESGLAVALALPSRIRRIVFFAGLGFHAAIAVAFGLVSFTFSMWAALLLYIGPHEFRWWPAQHRQQAARVVSNSDKELLDKPTASRA